LCDLSPGLLHPLRRKSYLELWQEMVSNAPRLDLVLLD
jgi:hypothetical protein